MTKVFSLLAIAFIVLCTFQAYSQITTFNFRYNGPIPAPCNPFKDEGNYSQPWKPSHGSPKAGDVYGQYFYGEAELRASFPAPTGSEYPYKKSDGLFIAHSFPANRLFDINITLAHAQGSVVGLEMYAANNITKTTNTSCDQAAVPSVSEKLQIYSIPFVPDPPTGMEEEITIKNFATGSTAFTQLWVYATEDTYTENGSVYIFEITIEDKGPSTTNPPPPTTDCPVREETTDYGLKVSPPDGTNLNFGHVVRSSGNDFVVGAPGEGKVYVYKMEGCTPVVKATLTPDSPGDVNFGTAVDIQGDQIIVGAPNDVMGHVYFYQRTGETWTKVSKISVTQPRYGFSVALTTGFAVVSAPFGQAGLGLVYFYSNSGFSYQPWILQNSYNGWGVDDEKKKGKFGWSVDIEGSTAIVGDPGNNCVYFFNLGVSQGYQSWEFKNRLVFNPEEEGRGKFGNDIKLSDNGASAYATGAFVHTVTWHNSRILEEVIYRFKQVNNLWSPDGYFSMGVSYSAHSGIAVEGSDLVIRNNTLLKIYKRTGTSWSQITTVPRYDDYHSRDLYGLSNALSNGYFIAGTPEPFCTYSGSIYIYDIFASSHSDEAICFKTYSGNAGTVYADNLSAGCSFGTVIVNPGATLTYAATNIVLRPGFHAKNGSTFTATGTGCRFGTSYSQTGRINTSSATLPSFIQEDSNNLISSADENETTIFPNPATEGRFKIITSNPLVDYVDIVNVQGILVQRIKVIPQNQYMMEVDLSGESSSIYMVKGRTTKKAFIEKIIVR